MYHGMSRSLDQACLIQRMTTKKDASDSKKISENFELDYMGSSEFEFGAIPATLREYNKVVDELVLHKIELKYRANGIKLNGKWVEYNYREDIERTDPFYVLVPKDVTKEEIQTLLQRMAERKHRLQEGLHLNYFEPRCSSCVDTWMCLDTPLVFFRNKASYYLFVNGIKNSVKFMDAEKEKHDA